MRTIMYILTTIAVVGLAFWAYRENYATQESLARAEQLRRDIRQSHSRLAVLRAEWAYLNRPDRLRDLADINFDRLGLMNFRSDQFGRIDEVAYPVPEPLPITNVMEVSGNLPTKEGEWP